MRDPDEYFTWYGTGSYYDEYVCFTTIINVWTDLSLMPFSVNYEWYDKCPWMID
jgi:hypothetical protein